MDRRPLPDAGLTATLANISATEGTAFNGTVATFHDADANTTAQTSDFTAVITWDDGTTSSGTVGSSGGGAFTISGSHTFARAGSRSVNVVLVGPGNGGIRQRERERRVCRPHASPVAISAIEGTLFNGAVAHFTDAYSSTTAPASDYAATVTWDDGTTSVGAITSQGSGQYTVSSAHTFTRPGSLRGGRGDHGAWQRLDDRERYGDSLRQPDFRRRSRKSPSPRASPSPEPSRTFHDLYSGGTSPATDFSATITWDTAPPRRHGPPAQGGGAYTVSADHTFNHPGSQSISVAISGPGSSSAATSGNVSVASAPITVALSSISATEGQSWSGTVATFADGNAGTVSATSEFSTTITWDDGTTTPAQ